MEKVTKLDIAKNKTVYSFSGFTSTGPAASPTVQAVTDILYYVNTGTVASPTYSGITKEQVYCYNSAATNDIGCTSATVTLPITEVSVFTISNGMLQASWTSTTFDKYGNPLVISQYDFGATSPTIVTTNVYSPTGSCGPASTVTNKLCSSVTVNSGSTVASSKNTYSAAGNLLTACVSPNGGSSFLCNSTANTYNGNGTPLVLRDLANNPTTYGYTASYYTGSPTNLPFATSVTAANGLITYAYYNSAGGVKTKDVDAAGNATLYGYTDPWNRVTSITDPLSNVKYQTYSPTELTTALSFNGGSSAQNVDTFLDGYGRTINVQKQQGPSATNWDTVSSAYKFTTGSSPNFTEVDTFPALSVHSDPRPGTTGELQPAKL
jgi:hypothetical protein